MRTTLRIITIVCYFLPFTFYNISCNNLVGINVAYNKDEADINSKLEKKSIATVADSTIIKQQDLADTICKDIDKQLIQKESEKDQSNVLIAQTNYSDTILTKALFPTHTSLSGIGSIFYFKNLIGKIMLEICFTISMILLLLFKFLNSTCTTLFLLIAAVICLTIFFTDCFISNVTLLWGSWTLLLVLLIQVLSEFKLKSKVSS